MHFIQYFYFQFIIQLFYGRKIYFKMMIYL